MSNNVLNVPEGMEIDLNIYLKSDSLDITTAVKLSGIRSLTQESIDKYLQESFNLFGAVDWQFMNVDEIKEYKEDEEKQVQELEDQRDIDFY